MSILILSQFQGAKSNRLGKRKRIKNGKAKNPVRRSVLPYALTKIIAKPPITTGQNTLVFFSQNQKKFSLSAIQPKLGAKKLPPPTCAERYSTCGSDRMKAGIKKRNHLRQSQNITPSGRVTINIARKLCE